MVFRIAAAFRVLGSNTHTTTQKCVLGSTTAARFTASRWARSSKRYFSNGLKETENGIKKDHQQTMMQRFLGHKEIPPKGTFAWYREMVLLCTVFAITGSSTMLLVRTTPGSNSAVASRIYSHNIHSFIRLAQTGATGHVRDSGSERKPQGWTVVLPDLQYCDYDSPLCDVTGVRGDTVWTAFLLSPLCGQNVFQIRHPTRADGPSFSQNG